MAAVTICSEFGAQKTKSVTVSIVFPSICHEEMGADAMILVFLMLSFKPTFSLSSFTFIKKLFNSSGLSAISVVSSVYLWLLIFLLATLNPVYDSSILTFCMMYFCIYVKQAGWQYAALPYSFFNFEPVCCSMSNSTCCFLTTILVFQEIGKVDWYSHLLKNFKRNSVSVFKRSHSLLWSTHSKSLVYIVNKAEVDVFLELLCFLSDLTDAGSLISGSSAFSKPGLFTWNFSVHILLKPSLKDFKHYLANMWNECTCTDCGASKMNNHQP